MCSAGGLISLQVGQGIANFAAGSSQARIQRRQQGFATESQIKSTLQQEAALQIQNIQDQEEISREKQASSREARRIRATSIAAMAESGQTGPAAARILDDLIRQGENKQLRLDARSESVNQATKAQMMGLNAQHFNRLNEINQPINKPSVAGALLGIASDVTQTLVMSRAMQSSAAGVKNPSTGASKVTSKAVKGKIKVGAVGNAGVSQLRIGRK